MIFEKKEFLNEKKPLYNKKPSISEKIAAEIEDQYVYIIKPNTGKKEIKNLQAYADINTDNGYYFTTSSPKLMQKGIDVLNKYGKEYTQKGNSVYWVVSDKYARETERIIKLAQDASPSVKKKLIKEFNSWHDREDENTFASDDKSFPYRMLSRLQSDCKYVLAALKGNSKDGKLDLETINKFLWFNDIDKQIAFMKGIYERLDEKPEWITLEEIEGYDKQMKELIRTESIKENLDPEHSEDSPKQEDTGIAQMLIDAINGEWDTIKLYNDILVNAESYGNSDIADVIRDIVAEENTHIGQLQKALETISPNVSKIKEGETEAENQLTNETEIKDLQNYELGE